MPASHFVSFIAISFVAHRKKNKDSTENEYIVFE